MTQPKLSTEPLIHDGCDIANCEFGNYTEIGKGTRMSNVQIDDYSYCDRMCDLSNAQIGKFANIASFVRIGATDHPLDRASLHHFMYRSADYWPDAEHDTDWFAKRAARTTYIGNDTWIGHNAQIKPEVRVGDGAVIASGAVVTKDVAPYTIVGGLPASPIRRRLSQELSDRMIELAWWDWDHDRLRETLSDFRSLKAEEFLDRYED